MYRIDILEDETIQRDILKGYIKDIFNEITNNFEIIEYSCGEEMLEEYPQDIDIFFIDMQMGELSGMDVAKVIREKYDEGEIIFTTSLIDYIQDGYKVRAYRYLLKPIKYDDIREHVLACVDEISKKRDNYMIIEDKISLIKIKIEDITYIEVIKKKVIIHTKENIYETKISLNKVEKELKKYKFFRCQRSFLVSLNHIQQIGQGLVAVHNEKIPVSRHRLSELKQRLALALGDVLC